ncbi:MAG: type Z 30S ribosomal protein S14 [Dehalococcoidia bacterium]
MAKVSMTVRAQRPPKYRTRQKNRCRLCGRPRAYMRYFGICRICFRQLALEGKLPGVKKSSW